MTDITICELIDKIIESWKELAPLITGSRKSIEEKYDRENIAKIIDKTYEVFASYSKEKLFDYRKKGKEFSLSYNFMIGNYDNNKFLFFPDTFYYYYRYPILEALDELKKKYIKELTTETKIKYEKLTQNFLQIVLSKTFIITNEEFKFLKKLMNPIYYKQNYIDLYRNFSILDEKKKFQEIFSNLRLEPDAIINYGKLGYNVMSLKKESEDLVLREEYTIFHSNKVHIRIIPRVKDYSIKDVPFFIEKAKKEGVLVERITNYFKWHNLEQHNGLNWKNHDLEKSWTNFTKEDNKRFSDVYNSSWNMKQHSRPVLRENVKQFKENWYELNFVVNLLQKSANRSLIERELEIINSDDQLKRIMNYLKDENIYSALTKFSERLGLSQKRGYYIEYKRYEGKIVKKLAVNYVSYGGIFETNNKSLILATHFPNKEWAEKFYNELMTIKNISITLLKKPKMTKGRLRDTIGSEEVCKDFKDIKRFGKKIRRFKYDKELWYK